MTYGILASDHGVRAAIDKSEHYFTNLFRGTFGNFRGKKEQFITLKEQPINTL